MTFYSSTTREESQQTAVSCISLTSGSIAELRNDCSVTSAPLTLFFHVSKEAEEGREERKKGGARRIR